jgi:hypothetical protein
MTTFAAHFNGRAIIPDERVDLPLNEPLTVEVRRPPRASRKKSGPRVMTGKDLVDSGLFGIWKNRTDIGDSLEFARRLRKQAETRHHEIDDPT